MKSSIRWALTPPAIIAAFIAAVVLVIPVNYTIHTLLWSTGHQMPGKQFLMVVMPFDGAIAAFLVVLIGAFTAPRRRILTAFIVLISGAAIAWVLVGEIYSPTYYPPKLFPDGPPRVWSPIVGTYVGGLLGALVIAIRERKKGEIK